MRDLFEQVLRIKNTKVVDEIAVSAELLIGQGKEARPLVIIRGLSNVVVQCEERGVEKLYMSREEDPVKGAL
jgi:F420-0:gamma-glutamyl ligase